MTALAAKTSASEVALLTHPITYPVTKEEIEKIRVEYAALTKLDANNPEHYEEIRIALGKLRTTRTAIEKRRVDLKAGALDYGKKVDAGAKTLTVAIVEIEGPLQAKKDAVDEARENAKRAAEKAEMLALEAKIKADQEAEAAKIAKDREAHAAERAAFEAKQADADKKRAEEQAALDAQRAEVEAAQRKLDEDKAAAARAEEERLARIQAEADAKAAAERARVEAERASARAAEESARLEALRPETERVRSWASAFRELAANAPSVESDDARRAIEWAQGRLRHVAAALETYAPAGA